MRKRTKIVATVAGHSCTAAFLTDLFDAGVNVVRLNTAHQNPDEVRDVVLRIRAVSQRVAILLDTKGPEIRTVKEGEDLHVRPGHAVRVEGNVAERSQGDRLFVSLADLPAQVPVGASLLIDDGELELAVVAHDGPALVCMPQSEGVIRRRKSVNIPNVPIDLPTLSARDMDFLRVAAEVGVDYVAHSFVRTREDVLRVREVLEGFGARAKVIAKIENQQGVDNIDQILDHADGIMVARGDLGIEIPGERVPQVQRMLVSKCVESQRPVIIATQMLHSMIDSPRPTRAEISDVASAIYQRTDAIMLSGETAYGKYPLESVRTMARIADEVEMSLEPLLEPRLHRVDNRITETLTRAAVQACLDLPVKAIVVDTLTGRTARYLSAFRGRVPIYAICYRSEVMRELALSYGVEALHMERYESRDQFLIESMSLLLRESRFAEADLILVIGGSFGPSKGATFMEIGMARDIVRRPFIHE